MLWFWYRMAAVSGLYLFFATYNFLFVFATFDTTGSYLYVANCDGSNISAYSVDTAGDLSELAGSPFSTHSGPVFITLDPTGKYLYTANSYSNDVSAFSIDETTGVLTELADSPYAVGIQPVSIAVTCR